MQFGIADSLHRSPPLCRGVRPPRSLDLAFNAWDHTVSRLAATPAVHTGCGRSRAPGRRRTCAGAYLLSRQPVGGCEPVAVREDMNLGSVSVLKGRGCSDQPTDTGGVPRSTVATGVARRREQLGAAEAMELENSCTQSPARMPIGCCQSRLPAITPRIGSTGPG